MRIRAIAVAASAIVLPFTAAFAASTSGAAECPPESEACVPTTTQAPTTEAPTTEAPTTEAPTTQAPTTQAPTSVAPTSAAPTTKAPTTTAPKTDTKPATAVKVQPKYTG